jgi:Zn-dependent M28 family amino/carboxypeptidase
VIVGAHYDTAPGGTPGANDNASGTAAALALASRLAGARHRLPIRIVLFANEEPPYYRGRTMGSLQYAAGCRKRGEDVRAMLSLETIGFYSEEPGSQHYPPPLHLLYPDRGNFIAFVGNLASRALVRDAVQRFRTHARFPSEGAALPDALPGIGWSDHWSFWQFGYPALMVTDTALFRDPNYHERSDVVENLDFERLARVVAGLQRVIEELASQ